MDFSQYSPRQASRLAGYQHVVLLVDPRNYIADQTHFFSLYKRKQSPFSWILITWKLVTNALSGSTLTSISKIIWH
jgi:hypothetical protein